jgi:hypothetical protein
MPVVPPRLLAAVVKVVGFKRLLDWFFGHYMAIAPPEAARLPAEPIAAGERQDAELVAP